MKKPKTKTDWVEIPQPPEDSNLVSLTREFEDLTNRISDLDTYSTNEQTLLAQAWKEYQAVAKRVEEVHSMNARTKREQVVRLNNVREQIQQLTGQNRLENCYEAGQVQYSPPR